MYMSNGNNGLYSIPFRQVGTSRITIQIRSKIRRSMRSKRKKRSRSRRREMRTSWRSCPPS
jgi:hypothetical protein